MGDNNQSIRILILLVVLVVVIVFTAAALGAKIPGLSKLQEPVNPYEEVYINHIYEVTQVYRMYDGSHMPYAVDYTKNGSTKTLIAFTENYAKNIITVYPNSNKTCLVYNERWFFYENGDKIIIDNKFNYELYLTNDTMMMGVPTHYSRGKTSDFDSTVVIIK